jgi:predicted nuclease of restriction endonuclease-like RecB superfamily
LLADRPEGMDHVATRAEVFLRAEKAHREATRPIDRDRILAEAAEALGTSPADVDAALFADLRAAQVIKGFEAVAPSDLLASYDLALAQAALFRATRVTLRFEGAAPAEVRAVFRAARFHGLLFSIARHGDAFEVVVDGPFSLFGSAQKYGFRLAMFLPTALSLPRFELRADLRLGAAKEAVEMVITHADDVACRQLAAEAARPEIDRLVSAFRALPSEWTVAACDELLPLPGQAVIVPDLSFTSQKSGEVVYLEMMGFWSRDAVWKRIEQIEQGLDARLIIAVKKSLRVSREALDGSTGSSLLVFGTAPSAKEVLTLLEGG